MRGQTRRALLLVVLLAITVAQAPARADCAAPYVTVDRSDYQAGDRLTVRGEHFAAECNDTGTGCTGPRRSPPSSGIDVQLKRDGEIVASEVVDADDGLGFTAELTIPEEAPWGEYRVVAVEDRPYRQEWESEPFVVGTP